MPTLLDQQDEDEAQTAANWALAGTPSAAPLAVTVSPPPAPNPNQTTPPAAVPPTALDAQDEEEASAGVSPQPAPDNPSPPTHPVEAPTNAYDGVPDAINFLRTALTNAVTGVAGVPHLVEQGANWLYNAENDALGRPEQQAKQLFPSAQQMQDAAYNHWLPEYQPQTDAGRYAMAGATSALPAFVAPESIPAVIMNAVRGGAAGIAGQGFQNAGLPGWLGPVATAGGELLGRGGVDYLRATSPVNTNRLAGQIANEVAPVNPSLQPAIPGMQATVGQLSGDPNWLAMDRELENPVMAQARRSANIAVVKSHLDTATQGSDPAAAASAQAGVVSARLAALTKEERSAWSGVGEALFDAKPLKEKLTAYKEDMQANEPQAFNKLPQGPLNDILDGPDIVPLRRLKDSRSAFGAATRNPDTQAAGVAKQAFNLVREHMEDGDNLLVQTPNALAKYKAAVAKTKEKYDLFGNDGEAGVQMKDIAAGKVAPENTLARVLPPNEEGVGARSLARLKKTVGTGAGLGPARAYLIGKLKAAVTGGADTFNEALRNYGYALNDGDMFTSAQRQVIKDATDAVGQTFREAPAGAKVTSPTLGQVKGGTFSQLLYGRVLGKIEPMLRSSVYGSIAKAVSYHTGLHLDGELVAPLAGTEAGLEASKTALTEAREAILKTLDEIRQNPQTAAQMQLRASAANLKMAPRVRAMLKMLGLSETEVLSKSSGRDPSSVAN